MGLANKTLAKKTLVERFIYEGMSKSDAETYIAYFRKQNLTDKEILRLFEKNIELAIAMLFTPIKSAIKILAKIFDVLKDDPMFKVMPENIKRKIKHNNKKNI